MKDKLRVAAMVLLTLALVGMAGGFWTFVSMQAEKERAAEMTAENGQTAAEEGGIEAMYIPIGPQGDSWIFADASGLFEAEIPQGELYNESGKQMTPDELYTGDVLRLYGDIIATKSIPPQYTGVEKMVRISRGNVEDAKEYASDIQKYKGKPIYAKEREEKSLLDEPE